MVTAPSEAQDALGALHSLLERDLNSFWARQDLSNPARVRDNLLGFMPKLVETYGDGAITLALDWFDELREAQGVLGSYTAPRATVIAPEYIEERARFGAGSLWGTDPDAFRLFLIDASAGYITQAWNDAIATASVNDPVKAGWARIPEPGACSFCLMLASRGFVYESKETAGETARYHGSCRCTAVPAWDETRARVLYGYDPAGLYERYLSQRNNEISAHAD